MTADHIDRTAEVLGDALGSSYSHAVCRLLVRRLDAAGLLVSPEHDAAVAAKALRQMHDEMSRWEGWDTRDIGHAFLSESVLDALDDAADRTERGD